MTPTPATIPPTGALTSERTAGWALLGLTLITAGGLIATAWQGHLAVGEATRALVLGQGNDLLRDMRAPIRDGPDRPAKPETLRRVLEQAKQEQPVHYLAMFDPVSGLTSEAGESSVGRDSIREFALQAPNWTGLMIAQGRAVIVKRVPPSAAQAAAAGRQIPRERYNRIALEFVPEDARELQATATRTILVGGSAALLLVLTSIAFVRLLRHRADLERRMARDKQLAALGEMSAVLAHEIRNPLASLKGHAQLLAEGFAEESKERKKVDRIVNEAVRLQQLSADLLDFVRSAEVAPTSTDLPGLLRRCAEGVEGPVELELERAPAKWTVDPVRLEQVVVNLLTNARQASPAGAPVVLRASESSQRLTISVSDQGDGIPSGQEEKIYEPFHTTRTRGTGLGLAVARKVVEMHGGELQGGNREQGGAEFTVRLPRGI